MSEVAIRAIILLLVFILAGYLISRATKGLIRLVVIAVLTGLFLVAARSMINQILESRAGNSFPQTQPPQVNVTVSPTATAAPNPTASPATPTATLSPEAIAPDTPLQARLGIRNIPLYAAPYVASVNGGRNPAQAQNSTSQPQDFQPDYADQQPAAQRPTTQQPITGGW